ncbi:alpha/beta fold hydrolase [Jatrophihabitans lederbergiae]|uniref:Alpha/beta fold hydrolase n=1 Tax=Jatrophihabitans lederbergiae TaxID=3075547 RepID=A0ABU2JH21_9ACTN|nr:alpha/beta fold hydrolase [Jatrophihabitans sp. DSM 44399]MDT0264275.1 alpha/beta fold hydrolase [Jatrophihabitans sp. DSM 44399]
MISTRLVLLHGVGLDHSMWQPVVAALPSDVVVWAPDLLGHGANPPAPQHTTLTDLAASVVGGLRPGDNLVGFSLGALVAQHIARYEPTLVATLTNVSSVCQRTASERSRVLDRLAGATGDFPSSVAASLERWYRGTSVGADAVERTRVTLLANDVGSYLSCYRVFATADAEIGPELPRITAPSLAITGELDTGSTPEMSQRLADAIPGCSLVVVPGARHLLPVQNPRAVADAVTAFLGEIAHA